MPPASTPHVPSYTVYILRCADGSYYTGHTESLEPRLAAHIRGDIPGYTSARRPVHLTWSTTFPTREEALAPNARSNGGPAPRKKP